MTLNHTPTTKELEGIVHCQRNDISVKVSWQCGTNRQTFAVAVKVVVRLPRPLPLEIPCHPSVRRLEVRLQGAVHLADIHKSCRAIDGADPIADVHVEAL